MTTTETDPAVPEIVGILAHLDQVARTGPGPRAIAEHLRAAGVRDRGEWGGRRSTTCPIAQYLARLTGRSVSVGIWNLSVAAPGAESNQWSDVGRVDFPETVHDFIHSTDAGDFADILAPDPVPGSRTDGA